MQLERKRKDLEAQGIRIAAVSYDTVAILKHFSDRSDIGYPLLSDPGSELIKKFGILNTTVPEDHRLYGIPNPGEYLVKPDRMVQAKFFEEKYQDRFTGGHTLVRELGVDTGGPRTEVETDHLTVTAWASDQTLRGGNRFALALDVDLKDKMHVYAPSVEDYIPIAWSIEEVAGLTNYEAEYPESHDLHLPAINQTVPVYEGKFRVVRDLMVGQDKEIGHLLDDDGNLLVKGKLRYQACDDKVCFIPQTVDLEWKFKFEAHDRTRVPENLR